MLNGISPQKNNNPRNLFLHLFLEKEQDMPIEELMKLYGYAKPTESAEAEGVADDEEAGMYNIVIYTFQ